MGSDRPGRSSLPADLPAWPLYALFVGYPLWWVLGLSAFAPAMAAAPMLVLLAVRGRVDVPVSFAIWGCFLLFATTAVVMVDGPLRLVGYGVRWSNYAAATVVFLYAYNSSHRRLPRSKALFALAFFFGFVVVGGFLGLLLPGVRLTTPVQFLLPGPLLENEYVRALVSPSMAEVQQPYGSPRAFTRPSAPFAYTNGWGCNVALLVPITLAALGQANTFRSRTVLVVALVAATAPAAGTLNRGLYIALLVGFCYAALHLALRGRVAVLAALVVGVAGAVVAASATGVLSSLGERLHYSQTNLGRSTIYREAFEGTVQSPLLGNGAPRPSALLDISIGTQGQVWNVMFSYGFPALACFVGWFAAVAWLTRRPRDDVQMWLHVCVVVVLLTMVYYGYDGPQLSVAMLAAALAMRPPAEQAVESVPVPASAALPPP